MQIHALKHLKKKIRIKKITETEIKNIKKLAKDMQKHQDFFPTAAKYYLITR